MSKLLIETETVQKINENDSYTEIKRSVKKEAHFDLSDTEYTIKEVKEAWMKDEWREYELIPKDVSFLNEITDLFPASEYEFSFVQDIAVWKSQKGISLQINIRDRETKEKIFIPDSVVLSDEDYDYLLGVFDKELPQHNWMSARDALTHEVISFLSDSSPDILLDTAEKALNELMYFQYEDFKLPGYVDFDCDMVENIRRNIVDKALQELLERQRSLFRGEDTL